MVDKLSKLNLLRLFPFLYCINVFIRWRAKVRLWASGARGGGDTIHMGISESPPPAHLQLLSSFSLPLSCRPGDEETDCPVSGPLIRQGVTVYGEDKGDNYVGVISEILYDIIPSIVRSLWPARPEAPLKHRKTSIASFFMAFVQKVGFCAHEALI